MLSRRGEINLSRDKQCANHRSLDPNDFGLWSEWTLEFFRFIQDFARYKYDGGTLFILPLTLIETRKDSFFGDSTCSGNERSGVDQRCLGE